MCLNCSYAHIHCFTTWLQIGTVRCLGQMRQGQSSPIYFIFTLHHPIPNRQHIDRQVIKAAVLTASSQYLSLWSQSGLNQASDGLAVWEGWSQPHNKHCDFGPAFDETAPRCPFHQTKPQSVYLLFFLCLGILIPPLISLSLSALPAPASTAEMLTAAESACFVLEALVLVVAGQWWNATMEIGKTVESITQSRIQFQKTVVGTFTSFTRLIKTGQSSRCVS